MSNAGLSDLDLIAYVDGEAEPEVVAQIEQTPAYQAQAAKIAQQQREISHRLQGLKRPSLTELAEYHLGVLPKPQTRQIARYLAEHPHAAHQLERLQKFFTQFDPPPTAEPSLLDRARLLIAELFSPGSSLQPVAVRGTQEEVYQAGEFQIVLGSEPDPVNVSRRLLAGLVVGVQSGDWEAVIWQTGVPPYTLATVPVDEDGNFIVSNLSPGDYKLMVRNRETAVQIYLQTTVQ